MGDPVLHLIAGPNGAGKTTLHRAVIGPVVHLPFINADVIAQQRWPGAAMEHAYQAAALATQERADCLAERRSFVTETVFSHPSKLELLEAAKTAGYRTYLHIVLIPEELAVARVIERVTAGGHAVPEEKIRGRFARLWAHVALAIQIADEARVYDNSDPRHPLRLVATYVNGQAAGTPTWPAWVPNDLRDAGR